MLTYSISKDKNLLDVDFIHGFLTNSYWAEGRSKDKVITTIENSICYGMYVEKKQIGFARVLSDKEVFAYLLDVFIDEKYKGQKYGHALMQAILEDTELQNVERWMLATVDAQDFYRKFNFENMKRPERIMGLLKIKSDVHI
jgi:N-acetylglutamate synthase-like GNAT family acetyltransferase